jgi:hypothetical protein
MMSKWRKDVIPLVEIQIPSRGLELALTNWNNLFTIRDMLSSQLPQKKAMIGQLCIFLFSQIVVRLIREINFFFSFLFVFYSLEYRQIFYLFIYLFRLDMHTQPPGQQTGGDVANPNVNIIPELLLLLLPVRCNEIPAQQYVYRV